MVEHNKMHYLLVYVRRSEPMLKLRLRPFRLRLNRSLIMVSVARRTSESRLYHCESKFVPTLETKPNAEEVLDTMYAQLGAPLEHNGNCRTFKDVLGDVFWLKYMQHAQQKVGHQTQIRSKDLYCALIVQYRQ